MGEHVKIQFHASKEITPWSKVTWHIKKEMTVLTCDINSLWILVVWCAYVIITSHCDSMYIFQTCEMPLSKPVPSNHHWIITDRFFSNEHSAECVWDATSSLEGLLWSSCASLTDSCALNTAESHVFSFQRSKWLGLTTDTTYVDEWFDILSVWEMQTIARL